MKKLFFLMIALSLIISACATPKNPLVPSGAANPSPTSISQKDLKATSEALVQQTLQAQPTPTLASTNTPVVVTETPAITPSPTVEVTATETQNPILLTLTATLGTGTPFTTPGTPSFNATLAPGTPTITPANGVSLTPSVEPTYPLTYGTMPPNVPAAKVTANNQTKDQAYVSVHCTTKQGYNSIVESPVAPKSKKNIKVPAGSCSAVVWVGGKRFSTSFHLSPGGNVTLVITNKGVSAK